MLAGAPCRAFGATPNHSDVCSAVSQVEELRARDASRGLKIAQALEGFISRKVVKQTVMTVVYGVTRYGGRLQIEKRLKEIDEFSKVWGSVNVPGGVLLLFLALALCAQKDGVASLSRISSAGELFSPTHSQRSRSSPQSAAPPCILLLHCLRHLLCEGGDIYHAKDAMTAWIHHNCTLISN